MTADPKTSGGDPPAPSFGGTVDRRFRGQTGFRSHSRIALSVFYDGVAGRCAMHSGFRPHGGAAGAIKWIGRPESMSGRRRFNRPCSRNSPHGPPRRSVRLCDIARSAAAKTHRSWPLSRRPPGFRARSLARSFGFTPTAAPDDLAGAHDTDGF